MPLGAAASVALAVLTPLDQAAPARLLFSSRSFQALRLGMDRDLIPAADSARLLSSTETTAGVLSVWSLAGNLVELRRNGLPCGIVSTDTLTTPQPVPEVATAVLGLTIHPSPGSALILGDDAGLNLRTCCDFPVHTIVAVREDPAATAFASQFVWPALPIMPGQDDRVRFLNGPAALAMRRHSDQRFDVVITGTANPFSKASQPQLTQDFYRSVAARLTTDGVLSQRFQQYDLGAEPLVTLLSTASTVFSKVAAIQVAPGEIVLVATNSQTPLLDAGFLARLEKDHVRRELGRSGWDWAQLAGLPIIDAQDPIGLFDHETPRPPVRSGSGQFVFGLPWDAERWGDKAGELRDMFAPHQMRIAEATPGGPQHDEFRRRISAVAQQSEILANFPDQPWPYRNSLKMEMLRNPRPPREIVRDGQIRQVPDPADEFRKNYFIALGEALSSVGQKQGVTEAMAAINRFTLQYEPLISHFAHHELVRLHELASHPAPDEELAHRLHTVYFHEPGDHSVRHIAAAIDSLLQAPDQSLTPGQRFDHLNAMLQELIQRWQTRTQYEPKSAVVVQNDVDNCVQAANRALDELEHLATEVGVSRTEFLARRRYVNSFLISPLRNYRDEIVSHRIKASYSDLASDADAGETTVGPGELPLLMNPADVSTN
ncbi:MAG: hypothetical protein R3C19_03515 [Planctomycetaceae bacterium]